MYSLHDQDLKFQCPGELVETTDSQALLHTKNILWEWTLRCNHFKLPQVNLRLLEYGPLFRNHPIFSTINFPICILFIVNSFFLIPSSDKEMKNYINNNQTHTAFGLYQVTRLQLTEQMPFSSLQSCWTVCQLHKYSLCRQK